MYFLLRRILQELVYQVTNKGRGFTNGELDDQRVLEYALEFREKNRDDLLLYDFFDVIVKQEREVIDDARQIYQNDQKSLDVF